MTWGELKKKVEELGVKDDAELWYVDVNFSDQHVNLNPEDIEADKEGPYGSVAIFN